uniref:SCP domain-containing protein n=1 Tax=Panagrellus redivivus TaxID=6233 RepID=A0A7E4W7E8_PANRE
MRVVTTVFLLAVLLGEGDAARQCKNRLNSGSGSPALTVAKKTSFAVQPKAADPITEPPIGINCYVHQSRKALPMIQKCDGKIVTSNEIGNAERASIVDSVDHYRAFITSNCKLGLGGVKAAANFRRTKYSCALEEASKFSCTKSLSRNNFKSDAHTYRRWSPKNPPAVRSTVFYRLAPFMPEFSINPADETASGTNADFVRFFMSEDVTEVGCYVKNCGNTEYMACKSNHDTSLPSNYPIYTPGKRCEVDSDCTLPGFNICDVKTGMCDYKTQLQRKQEELDNRCDDVVNYYMDSRPEVCNNQVDTGSMLSNDERYTIVKAINGYRQLLQNNCKFVSGVQKAVSNYRKVKYSCAYEQEMKFECSDVSPTTFKSDKYTFRFSMGLRKVNRRVVFLNNYIWKSVLAINPNNQRIESSVNDQMAATLRTMMSPDVTEIGCYDKICGNREYIACKTGQVVVASKNTPLYTPGSRCNADSDCTLPGYGVCDTFSGLCEESGNDKH